MTSKSFLETQNKNLFAELEKEGLYPISILESRLRKEGFANTKISIYSLEDKGKIPSCSERRQIRGRMWRLYTKERIDEIVKALEKLPHKKMIQW